MTKPATTTTPAPSRAETLDTHEANFKAMREKDAAAKKAGELLGRYLQESYADGYAFYEIVKVNKATVRIKVVTGIGDDWVLPYWGVETSIPIGYAIRNIDRRDGLAALFGKK